MVQQRFAGTVRTLCMGGRIDLLWDSFNYDERGGEKAEPERG